MPLLIWVLALGVRAYFYGGALDEHRFLDDEAQTAQDAWQSWANRYLAVHASCVLLPDQVTGKALIEDSGDFPSRKGEARRIAGLPTQECSVGAALEQVSQTLGPVLKAIPVERELHVTLLTDVSADHYDALRAIWEQSWTDALRRTAPTAVNVMAELSLGWIDQTLKSASAAFELIVVLQVRGGGAYSEGVAALLMSPDSLANVGALPIVGGLSRPMPLDIVDLEKELAQFFGTQTSAIKAMGLLADSVEWEGTPGKVIAQGRLQGSALEAKQQWIYESLCGQPGPLGHWLLTALALEMVRHQQHPLLVLAKDQSHWISTITTGEWA